MPHPLRSFYPTQGYLFKFYKKVEYFDTFVKHCPGRIGLFQAIKDPILIDYRQTGFQEITLDFYYDLQVRQVPAGGLVYLDHLHYEGQHHSSRLVELANSDTLKIPFHIQQPLVYTEKSHSITIQLSGTHEILKVHVATTIRGVQPGFYLKRITIADYFGQPYLDQNVVFRVRDRDVEKDIAYHQDRYDHYWEIQGQLFKEGLEFYYNFF